jgi:hypothetical protein
MLSVEKALRNRIVGDAALVAAAGGAHVHKRNPDLDIVALFAAGAKAVITFFCIDDGKDKNNVTVAEVYQFDVWARRSDDGAAVAERLTEIFEWDRERPGSGTLPDLVGRRLVMTIYAETVQPEATEVNDVLGALHHKVRQFGVVTCPA